MFLELGLLLLRVVVGLLMAGHGAQKLFGWFGGPGLAGLQGWLTSLGLRPASFWALMAGLAEFGGGLLLALGLLSPFGEMGIIAAMIMAILLGHWGNGLWAQNNGSELPLLNLTAALFFAIVGPGRYSLDALLGIALPQPLSLAVGLGAVLIGIGAALLSQNRQPVPAK